MLQNPESKKVYWHSRRGMLELDLILVPFVEQEYEKLSPSLQQVYKDLLSSEDTDLFSWFIQRNTPEQQDLNDMVQRIVHHAKTRERP